MDKLCQLCTCCFTPRVSDFRSHGDVTNAMKGCRIQAYLGSNGILVGRELYSATSAVTRDLSFCRSSEAPPPHPNLSAFHDNKRRGMQVLPGKYQNVKQGRIALFHLHYKYKIKCLITLTKFSSVESTFVSQFFASQIIFANYQIKTIFSNFTMCVKALCRHTVTINISMLLFLKFIFHFFAKHPLALLAVWFRNKTYKFPQHTPPFSLI